MSLKRIQQSTHSQKPYSSMLSKSPLKNQLFPYNTPIPKPTRDVSAQNRSQSIISKQSSIPRSSQQNRILSNEDQKNQWYQRQRQSNIVYNNQMKNLGKLLGDEKMEFQQIKSNIQGLILTGNPHNFQKSGIQESLETKIQTLQIELARKSHQLSDIEMKQSKRFSNDASNDDVIRKSRLLRQLAGTNNFEGIDQEIIRSRLRTSNREQSPQHKAIVKNLQEQIVKKGLALQQMTRQLQLKQNRYQKLLGDYQTVKQTLAEANNSNSNNNYQVTMSYNGNNLTIQQLAQQVNRKQQQLIQKQHFISKLKDQIVRLQETIHQLRSQTNYHLQKQQQLNKNKQNEINMLEEQLQIMIKSASEYQQQLKNKENVINTLQSRLQENDSVYESLKMKASSNQTMFEQYQHKINELQRQLNLEIVKNGQKLLENQQLKVQFQNISENLNRRESDVSNASTKIKQLVQQLSSTKQVIIQAQSQYNIKQDQSSNELVRLQNAMRTIKEELYSQKQKNKQLNQQKTMILQQATQSGNCVRRWIQKYESMQQDYKKVKNLYDELNNKLNSSSKSIEEYRRNYNQEQFNKLYQQVSELKEKLDQSDNQIKELKEKIASQILQKQELIQKMESNIKQQQYQKHGISQEKNKWAQQFQKLNNLYQQALEKQRSLLQQLEHQKQSDVAMSEQLKSAHHQMQKLQYTLNQRQSQLQQISRTVGQYKFEMQTISSQLNQNKQELQKQVKYSQLIKQQYQQYKQSIQEQKTMLKQTFTQTLNEKSYGFNELIEKLNHQREENILQLETQNENFRNIISQLESKNQQLQSEIFETKNSVIPMMQKTLQDMGFQKIKSSEKIQQSQFKIYELQSELAKLQSQIIPNLQRNNKDNTDKTLIYQTNMSEMSAKISQLENKLTNAKNQIIPSLQSQISYHTKRYDQLYQQLTFQKRTLTEIDQTLKQKQQFIVGLSSQIQIKNQTLNELQQKKKQLDQNFNILYEKYESKSQILNQLTIKNQQSQKQLKSMKSQRQSYQRQKQILQLQKARYHQLALNLEEQNKKKNQQFISFKSEISDIIKKKDKQIVQNPSDTRIALAKQLAQLLQIDLVHLLLPPSPNSKQSESNKQHTSGHKKEQSSLGSYTSFAQNHYNPSSNQQKQKIMQKPESGKSITFKDSKQSLPLDPSRRPSYEQPINPFHINKNQTANQQIKIQFNTKRQSLTESVYFQQQQNLKSQQNAQNRNSNFIKKEQNEQQRISEEQISSNRQSKPSNSERQMNRSSKISKNQEKFSQKSPQAKNYQQYTAFEPEKYVPLKYQYTSYIEKNNNEKEGASRYSELKNNNKEEQQRYSYFKQNSSNLQRQKESQYSATIVSNLSKLNEQNNTNLKPKSELFFLQKRETFGSFRPNSYIIPANQNFSNINREVSPRNSQQIHFQESFGQSKQNNFHRNSQQNKYHGSTFEPRRSQQKLYIQENKYHGSSFEPRRSQQKKQIENKYYGSSFEPRRSQQKMKSNQNIFYQHPSPSILAQQNQAIIIRQSSPANSDKVIYMNNKRQSEIQPLQQNKRNSIRSSQKIIFNNINIKYSNSSMKSIQSQQQQFIKKSNLANQGQLFRPVSSITYEDKNRNSSRNNIEVKRQSDIVNGSKPQILTPNHYFQNNVQNSAHTSNQASKKAITFNQQVHAPHLKQTQVPIHITPQSISPIYKHFKTYPNRQMQSPYMITPSPRNSDKINQTYLEKCMNSLQILSPNAYQGQNKTISENQQPSQKSIPKDERHSIEQKKSFMFNKAQGRASQIIQEVSQSQKSVQGVNQSNLSQSQDSGIFIFQKQAGTAGCCMNSK